MAATVSKMLRLAGALTAGLLVTLGSIQTAQAQQSNGIGEEGSMITYSRGQPVIPIYNGWHPNPDGTIDLWFGYLNNNWRQEPDVPVGGGNNISAPFGPDAGQPTHFFPRNNRFIFSIRVQKDFAEKEAVWTLTTNGKTLRAYATLNPAYIRDDAGMAREYFGGNGEEANLNPVINIEGPARRTLKVGEVADLKVIATDDGKPTVGRPGGGAPAGAAAGGAAAAAAANRRNRPSLCGAAGAFFCGEPNEGAGNLSSVKGLRMSCFLHRGDPEIRMSRPDDFGQAKLMSFDPPQEKVWEDHRGGSPWAAGYVLPPIPKDNTWNIKTTFEQPGTFVVRCQAHDGLLITSKDVTFEVTP